ncbi:hypothetical protein DYE50_03635 [Treponema ruminis]|uniref:Uncharacterized protein n=1 Tax=Treponema ruminis TaxID=744515 RepID=A0A7W8G7Y8_9SPIR|nr:hypothetical protein [Treponema ruminis]MBB5225460.1 hypothetical protein [Treponema ruminis]QSI01671.1 hypothetical protein DYE50_03635 [Treponema ruminis]
MNEMFVLQGATNTGKKKTLKALREMLKNLYPDYQEEELYTDTVYILSGKNTPKIGLLIDDKYEKFIKSHLETFRDKGCEIVFCACLTDGDTLDAVNTMKNDYSIHFIGRGQGGGFPDDCIVQAHELRKFARL